MYKPDINRVLNLLKDKKIKTCDGVDFIFNDKSIDFRLKILQDIELEICKNLKEEKDDY